MRLIGEWDRFVEDSYNIMEEGAAVEVVHDRRGRQGQLQLTKRGAGQWLPTQSHVC